MFGFLGDQFFDSKGLIDQVFAFGKFSFGLKFVGVLQWFSSTCQFIGEIFVKKLSF